jgi:nickel-dependent lactate racemase
MVIALPQLLWDGSSTLKIDLPDDWEVEICPMRGAHRPPLSVEQMALAIRDPIGSPSLKDLARGKKSAVIVFDDITRPTRTWEIAPLVLRELTGGGVDEEHITFVCALGTHGAHTAQQFRAKLGTEIVERFRVFNHNPYENCVEVGTTRRGTRLLINREVMEADLKIGIGCVTAHAQVAFSGGGKIILPGVAHMDSIHHYHRDPEAKHPILVLSGDTEGNVLRANIDEAARLAGLDFKVDVIVDGRGTTTGVLAGDVLEAHARAVALAGEVYATDPRPRGKELVIANAFTKANEMPIAALMGALALESFAGTVVVLANAPDGQIPHYLDGRFGSTYGGRGWPVGALPSSVRLVVVGPHLERTCCDWIANPDLVVRMKDWQSALGFLRDHHGRGTRVAVIADATMQYYEAEHRMSNKEPQNVASGENQIVHS